MTLQELINAINNIYAIKKVMYFSATSILFFRNKNCKNPAFHLKLSEYFKITLFKL